MANRHGRPAYTLLEITLVFALMAVITALTYPSVEGMYGSYRLTAAADTVRASWATARSRAVDEGRPYRCEIKIDGGRIRILPATVQSGIGGSESASSTDANNPEVVESELPEGFRFLRVTDPRAGDPSASGDAAPAADENPSSADWSSAGIFLPDGSAREDAVIAIQGKTGPRQVIKLRALTGAVKIHKLKPNEDAP